MASIANAQVMALAKQPRKQILATWARELVGGSIGNLVGLPWQHLYGLIAEKLGMRPVGDYAALPKQYALQDIYIGYGGTPGNYTWWGESTALANIYALTRNHGNNPGKIAAYRELNKDILLALMARFAQGPF